MYDAKGNWMPDLDKFIAYMEDPFLHGLIQAAVDIAEQGSDKSPSELAGLFVVLLGDYQSVLRNDRARLEKKVVELMQRMPVRVELTPHKEQ